MNQEEKYRVPALERGLRLLELLGEHPDGLAMPEMSSLELPAASLYRMLSTLAALGYAVRDENDRYRLSRKLLKLAYQPLDPRHIAEKAAGEMRKLRDRCGETVAIAVLNGSEGVVLDEAVSNRAVKVSVQIGHHFPLHTAAPAKAMLAFLPEEELDHLLQGYRFTRFNPRTLASREALLTELAEIRRLGVACDHGEELEEFRCVAAPVFDHRGYPIAAIWVSAPASRMGKEILEEYGRQVAETAGVISKKLL